MTEYIDPIKKGSDTHFKTVLSTIIGQLMGRYGVSRTLAGRLPYLLGALAAVESYQANKDLLGHDDEYHVMDTLSRTALSVEVSNKGRITTSVDVAQDSFKGGRFDYAKPVENVTVKKKCGRTIYQIQNLNIYITAEVVQQMNVNPKEVINYLHEQIQEEINRIGR